MTWDLLVRGLRRALDYLKPSSDSDDADADESTLIGRGWLGSDGRTAFPQAPEPALARIPK